MKAITAHLTHFVGTYARAAVLGAAVLTTGFIAPTAAHAGVFLSVRVAPPVIPVYEQPLCPGDGYIWTPGYWAYGDEGYYWIDGAWVEAPYEGALWTPGYWGYNDGFYAWNAGYWGTTVGYYGGINYGFGYFGSGFYGGRWNGGHFFYNSAYNRIDGGRFHNIYNDPSHGGGNFGHPGGRGFDPHPLVSGNRGSDFRGNGSSRGGFNQDNRAYNQQGNRGGFNQDNRNGFQGGNNQQRNFAAAPQTQPAQQQSYRQAYNGGDTNQGRTYGGQQQSINQPHSYAQAPQQQQSFNQPRSFAQTAPQQHFSQPVQQARPAQVYNAPQQQSFHGGGGGGGGFHGGGGGGRR